MNKNLYKGISFAVLAMLAAACQNNEDFSSEYDNNPNAVIVNATIGERTKTRVSTESETVDKWDDGDAIGIKGGATDKTATYTYNGTAWAVGSDYLTWDATGTNSFTAWYPANAAYDAFTLPKDQSAGISSADWMTASKSDMSKPADKQLSLDFAHKLSKVIVNVTKYGEEFNGTAPAISNVKLYIAGTPSVTGATVESSATSVTPYTGTQADSKPNYTAILLPGTYANSTSFIEMTVTPSGGQAKTLTVTVPSSLTSPGLEATKAYTFNLTVGKGAASIASVTVDEWTTSDMGKGEATGEPEVTPPAVGDFYYSDGTWSSTLNIEKTCIGIIFERDATNAGHGKIVSLDEPEANWNGWNNEEGKLKWSYDKVANRQLYEDTQAYEMTNGAMNMNTVKTFKSNDLTNYPAFSWCDQKNDGGISWYLPTSKELVSIYNQLTVINAAILNVSGTQITADNYWSSREDNSANYYAFIVSLGNGSPSYQQKKEVAKIRATASF